mgnify:FL=1
MEYAASEREQLLMLNQQIQLQSKNMTSASELYSAQRKKVHDFRAHLNILNRLMKNQEYSAAEEYLEKITEQQTDRLFLVNTHHPILDALFNTKAAEATQKKISIDFEVNDLSNLPFDVSDMVVLLSNLLDNAIEACQQYDKGDKAIHVMAVAQQDFFYLCPKHIGTCCNYKWFHSNDKTRTADAWLWTCEHPADSRKIQWRVYDVL